MFRVFDVIENRYSDKEFFIDKDGVLFKVGNTDLNNCDFMVQLDEADPSRYIVEEGIEVKGKQFFVGDSVTVWGSDGISINAEILFQDGCFNVQFKNPVYDKLLDTMRVRDYLKVYTSMHSIKVIGTIHNNPELLEVTE